MPRKLNWKERTARDLAHERASHERYVAVHPMRILRLMQFDLKGPPPSDEWYVKKWWRYRRDAVEERIEDLTT